MRSVRSKGPDRSDEEISSDVRSADILTGFLDLFEKSTLGRYLIFYVLVSLALLAPPSGAVHFGCGVNLQHFFRAVVLGFCVFVFVFPACFFPICFVGL